MRVLELSFVFFLTLNAVYGACPFSWLRFGNHCYKYANDIESWPAARAMCRWHHADLIAIETEAEQKWFVQQANTFNHTNRDQGFWLGGTDFSEEGKWTWISANFTELTYTSWGAFQPNNRNGTERCLAALKVFNYAWSDEFCNWDNMLQYVCEKKDPTIPFVVG